jgi:hypothetical protein
LAFGALLELLGSKQVSGDENGNSRLFCCKYEI